jgi:hypothetical protein
VHGMYPHMMPPFPDHPQMPMAGHYPPAPPEMLQFNRLYGY